MAHNLKSTDADTFSEFTEMTGDTEIGMLDNILDLKVSSIDFDRNAINTALGMKGALPNAVQTFVTVEFFNHDIKYTEINQGYEPQIET